ncbi:hypothetical protein [uncultured Sphingomonas sp.]|uniref:hypothetical protein n=1 Tax=uncultured Sphingomonas sp. TaxID=158754 RepID=UPI0025D8FB17|nr:hypothetical protein [uncultured Sphingomonas sp.]
MDGAAATLTRPVQLGIAADALTPAPITHVRLLTADAMAEAPLPYVALAMSCWRLDTLMLA